MKRKKLKKNIISIVSLLGFIVCTIALLYPVISDRWNRYRDMKLIAKYNEVVSNIDATEYQKILQDADDYNNKLLLQSRNIVTDAEYDPDVLYESLLNVTKNGIMGYIEIPKIGVKEPIYHYSTQVSLGNGIGHIHGSSLPVGGNSTHTVLTGHRGLPNQKFFSDLDRLEVGDNFYLHILDKTLAYKVYDIKTITPDDVGSLMIENDRDLATLVTCTPYGVNTHRLLVMGERTEFDEEVNVDDGFVTNEKHKTIIDPAVYVFLGFMLFILLLVIITIVRKIIKKGAGKNEEIT